MPAAFEAAPGAAIEVPLVRKDAVGVPSHDQGISVTMCDGVR